MRIGIGYDLHELVDERKLILGGVEIPHKFGLHGHSDADVLCHAIMDALLGALALGDIGSHFPDDDPHYKNANSLALLRTVNGLIRGAGYKVGNVDVTIVAEKPKLQPYIDRMRMNVAGALGVDRSRVSLKATTNEGLGPEGRQEAISVHAVALIEPSTGTFKPAL